jgi:type II secretory pathway pseudopilin PulG
MRLSRRQRRSGMSLLEVVLAMAIFLMALIGLSQLLGFCSQLGLDAQFTNRAAQLMQSKMNEVVSGVVPLTGQGDTEFDDDSDWVWSLEAEADTTAPGLYRVTVTVSRKLPDGTVLMTASLSQIILDPASRGTLEAPASSSSTGSGTTGSGATGSGATGSGATGGP